MNVRTFRRGFTLLEVLTASALLGLLASLLLSFFKQGEIAWSAGASTIEGMGCQERFLVQAAGEAADTIFVCEPKPTTLRLLSAWNEKGEIRSTRPIVRVETESLEVDCAFRPVVLPCVDGSSSSRLRITVSSAGPDGRWGTEDDLSTDPLEGIK